MDISLYFNPINIDDYIYLGTNDTIRLGHNILAFVESGSFPAIEDMQIALVGVEEERNAINNKGCSSAPNEIRKYLYRLSPHRKQVKIVDLGNIKAANTVEDTYYAVAEVVAELLRNRVIPIILGGSQDLSLANYRGYENIGQIINVFNIDSALDMGQDPKAFNSKAFLTSMFCREPNYLFNYTHIAYQTYFVDPEALDLMDNLYFETYRLGNIQTDLDKVEPLIRNADMVTIDIGAVRQADAPANGNASPHGLYGEELCKLTRYAGMSDKCSSIGFYELNPIFDQNGQTAHLVAHAIWYFLEGYLWRKQDFPYKDKENYKKFHVSIQNNSHVIVFYKSKKSERWWMEVPCTKDKMIKYERHYLVPCSYEDYQTALNDELPDRWLSSYNKMLV